MTVSTKTLPNNAAQVGAAYKAAIDASADVFDRVAGAFACHQNDAGSPDAPDLTVRVDAGSIFNGVTLLEVAAQSTSTLTAPISNPRRDIVYVDNATGVAGVASGAEAASPTDPAIPTGKHPVARIRWTVGMAEITNADLDDLRTFNPLGISLAASGVSYDPGSPSLLAASNVQQAIDELAALPRIVAIGEPPAWADSEANCTTLVKITRMGDMVCVDGVSLASGAFSGSQFEITIPAAYTPDSFYVRDNANGVSVDVGAAVISDYGSVQYLGSIRLVEGNTLRVQSVRSDLTTSSYAAITATSPMTWANNDRIVWRAMWRVSGW